MLSRAWCVLRSPRCPPERLSGCLSWGPLPPGLVGGARDCPSVCCRGTFLLTSLPSLVKAECFLWSGDGDSRGGLTSHLVETTCHSYGTSNVYFSKQLKVNFRKFLSGQPNPGSLHESSRKIIPDKQWAYLKTWWEKHATQSRVRVGQLSWEGEKF